ncbi:ninjurin-1 isoform X1 [Monodelphis domestica]|uniref:ninjurin-1 isoform X1 n=1 Tax=Monodelphis domestica TaxID=13616 RepID=UPI0024E205AD|nr:ninjurin-1 isoform X1 [Monodelphis domestica]
MVCSPPHQPFAQRSPSSCSFLPLHSQPYLAPPISFFPSQQNYRTVYLHFIFPAPGEGGSGVGAASISSSFAGERSGRRREYKQAGGKRNPSRGWSCSLAEPQRTQRARERAPSWTGAQPNPAARLRPPVLRSVLCSPTATGKEAAAWIQARRSTSSTGM